MKNFNQFVSVIGGVLLAAAPVVFGQPALVQTIDVTKWAGVPLTVALPPIPPPASGFSLTSIAINPVTNTVYVSDYATASVYMIDTVTKSVTSAVSVNGFFSTADIGASQNLPGTAPKVVLANPVTNRWLFMGQGGGAQFSGSTFVEGINARAFQSGGAWDPVTDNVYGADGLEFFAVNNLKFLYAGFPCGGSSNAAAVNPMTSRLYISCGNSQTGGGLVIFDGVALSKANVKIATPPLATALLGAQPTGLAINANTNRVYVAGLTSPSSLDVLDASSYKLVASIPGLPDQSTDHLMAGYNPIQLPRPIAVNALTNTIFVLNSVNSTISVFDGNTNALTGTISVPVPDGAVVSQPVQPGTLLSEIKPGNTIVDLSTGTLSTLGGAIAFVVNETDNTLYVAGVTGDVSVYALDPPTALAAFSVNGVVHDLQGLPAAGITVNATGPGGHATAVTDATGLFVLTGLPAGSYTVAPASASFAFSPASLTVSIQNQNLAGLSFQSNPPIVPTSYTLSPWTIIGAGVTTTATVTLNQPAPATGAVITLSASDTKSAKFPSTVTVAAGQLAVSFPVQGSGVSTTTVVTLLAKYNGGTASANLTVAPGDKAAITLATYSQSTHVLSVNATDNTSQATLNVSVASSNQLLGTMTNSGNGSYTLRVVLPAGAPASINVVSNLGAKTGQGVQILP
jgi:DNA-binding beta-propeller fold protein YncE